MPTGTLPQHSRSRRACKPATDEERADERTAKLINRLASRIEDSIPEEALS